MRHRKPPKSPKRIFKFDMGPLPVEIEDGMAQNQPIPFMKMPEPGQPSRTEYIYIQTLLTNNPFMTDGKSGFSGITVDGKKVNGFTGTKGSGEIHYL